MPQVMNGALQRIYLVGFIIFTLIASLTSTLHAKSSTTVTISLAENGFAAPLSGRLYVVFGDRNKEEPVTQFIAGKKTPIFYQAISEWNGLEPIKFYPKPDSSPISIHHVRPGWYNVQVVFQPDDNTKPAIASTPTSVRVSMRGRTNIKITLDAVREVDNFNPLPTS